MRFSRQMCKRLCAWNLSRTWRNILLLYIATFTVALPLICSNLQNTLLDKLYNRNISVENARLIDINAARYNRSLEILKFFRTQSNSTNLRRLISGVSQSTTSVADVEKALQFSKHTALHTRHKVDLVVTIITVSRASKIEQESQPNYFAQTLAAFIELLNAEEKVFDKFSIKLRVCNVDPRPKEYHDMTLVPDWIPIYQRFSDPQTPLARMTVNSRLNKEKDDYVYCLDKSLQENTSFILLIEDDALPRKELFSVIDTKIFGIFDPLQDAYPIIRNVTFIKLYHPERLLSYISIEPDRLLELFSLAVILTMIVMYAHLKWAGNRNDIPKSVWIMTFMFFIGIVLIIGRSNILEFRRLSSHLYQISPAPSCCTPAMLFPRQGAQLVSDYLKTVECKAKFGKDSALDELKKKKHLVTKLLVPNLFEHIGHFSSLRYHLLNPFIIT